MTHIISCDINLKGNLYLCQFVVLFLLYSVLYGQKYCRTNTLHLQGLRGHGHLCQITIVKPADGVTLRCFGWSTGQDFVPLHTTCRLQK